MPSLSHDNMLDRNSAIIDMPLSVRRPRYLRPQSVAADIREGLIGIGVRAQRHRDILQAFQLSGLEGLGHLNIDDSVAVRPGLLRPGPSEVTATTHLVSAWVPHAEEANVLRRQNVSVRLTRPVAFPAGLRLMSRLSLGRARAEQDVFVEDAYWVAETIRLADGVTVVFDAPYGHLTLICKNLVVGEGVTFTWQPPDLEARHPSRAAPDRGNGSDTDDATALLPSGNGRNGGDGGDAKTCGASGPDGADAPALELWTLGMNRWPRVALDGQDGWPGGPGCDGGNGGDGAPGRDGELSPFPPFFLNPGNGGRGGDGGRPSAGGVGGNGGHGGQWLVYAPKAVLKALSRKAPMVSFQGGEPGESGRSGRGGRAGRGGRGGRWFNIDAPTDRFMGVRLAGDDGADGRPDNRAVQPPPRPVPPVAGGDFKRDSLRIIAISTHEFVEKWNAPRIARIEPQRARVGERVRVEGENFNATDRLFMRTKGAAPAVGDGFTPIAGIQIRNANVFEFSMPDKVGGTMELEVRPVVGPAFRVEMLLLPTVLGVSPEGRLTPGRRATLRGTGFSPSSHVYLGGSDAQTYPEWVDQHTLTFKVHRGVGGVAEVEKNGEVRELLVSQGLAQSASAPLQVTLDTFRVVMLGDSVLWGQGLPQDQGQPVKIHEHVAAGLSERFVAAGNTQGIHVTNLAHSGAIIGLAGDGSGRQLIENTSARSPDGRPADGVGERQEVNASFPTILDQMEREFEGRSDTVDLVILNGGMNDVNARTLLPSIDDTDLVRRIHLHCGEHMETLLLRTARKFPSAIIVVVGYYPILSNASDLGKLPGYLAAIGVAGLVAAAFTPAFLTSGNPAAVAGVVLSSVATEKLVRAQLAHNCRIFYETSEKAMQQAIDRVNARLFPESRAAAQRIFLAAPEFEDADTALAPQAKLFGVDSLGGAVDDRIVRDPRQVACDAYNAGDLLGGAICHRASVGHPNPLGARLYGKEILAVLDMNGVFAVSRFASGFLWGTATAAYQVEGNITNNDWHHFTNTWNIQDRVKDIGRQAALDINLEPANDGVGHHDLATVRAELDRMKALGMNAYRFSIEWARVEPFEKAPENNRAVKAALEYYDEVVAAVLERQMTPIVTLNHLTLPDWVLRPPTTSVASLGSASLPFASDQDPDYLASKRGWVNDDTVDDFVRFAKTMATRYADRVTYWITLNEPVASMIGVGYIGGLWSPGFLLDGTKAREVYFNLLRAHVRAFDAIKLIYGQVGRTCRIGFAHAMMAVKLPPPETGPDSLDNFSAEENAKARNQFNYFFNWHFIDALITAEVNESLNVSDARRTPSDAFFGRPFVARLDFLGINYYRSITLQDGLHAVAANAGLTAAGAGYMGGTFVQDLKRSDEPHQMLNDLTWEMYPRGLYAIIKQASARYDNRLPILVSENGMPESIDRNRAAYTVSHVQQLLRASLERVPILGYLHWSIVDNFEWFEHYKPDARFGLFTVDRQSGNGKAVNFERHITEGAMALQYLIAENGIGRAVERFGVMHPKGYQVSPPLLSSGLMWQGQFNAAALKGDFSLYITRKADGTDIGMIFLKSPGMWYRLGQVVARESAVTFDFVVDGLKISCVADVQQLGFQLNGRLSSRSGARELDRDVRWTATRPPLFGNWHLVSEAGRMLQFSRMEGGFANWQVKLWQQTGSAPRWHSAERINVAGDDSQVSFQSRSLNFTLDLANGGNKLNGTLTVAVVGQSDSSIGSPVTAIRLSSGIS